MTGCGPRDPVPAQSGKAAHRASPVSAVDTVAIGFYNVENLFDLQFDGNEYPEYRPGALGWDKQMQARKLANIGSAIAALKVDVLGLCEIESREALDALQKELVKQGATFPHAASGEAEGKAGTATFLLSKYPVISINRFGGGPGIGAREVLEADVDVTGSVLKVFVNHWPSKRHPESQRLALARALRRRIERLSPRTEYVIIGDLNTGYDQWNTLRTEKLDDTRGRVGLNHELGTVIGGPGGFVAYVGPGDLCAGTGGLHHYDPWSEVPEECRWSLKFRGAPQTLDHILLSQALFDSAGFSYCIGSFAPFTWGGALLRDGVPYRWQMKGYGKRRFHQGEGYSDHLPVRARLYRGPFTCAPAKPRESLRRQHPPVSAGGFEHSLDGWMSCGAMAVTRDTAGAFAGRACMRVRGAAAAKNGCAARAVLERIALNAGRRLTIGFAIRGSGRLSVRVRSGTGKWRYYNGPSFTPSNSARYLPAAFGAWKRVTLHFTDDMPGSKDIEVELRAGKEAAFDFWIDEVRIGQ
jgi:endonuclease/exonuclease/phosphatase family metal-dependent hydrolase